MIRIEARAEKTDRFWAVRIDPIFDPENTKRGFQPKVTAYCDKDYSFEDHEYHWRRAEVSWYSVGSCEVQVADLYARAIALAVEEARKMDVEHGFSVTPDVTQPAETKKEV